MEEIARRKQYKCFKWKRAALDLVGGGMAHTPAPPPPPPPPPRPQLNQVAFGQ